MYIFDLSNEELIACNDLIKIVKEEIISKDKNVKAFNIGTNIGKISGASSLEILASSSSPEH